jgi:hypothetical protein
MMPDETRLEFHDPRSDGTVAIWEGDQSRESSPTRILCLVRSAAAMFDV